MPIGERIESVAGVVRWSDSIPLEYEYTAGVAGEKFLRGLMEGKILAGYCPSCKELTLPLRMYCVNCYGEIATTRRAGPTGRVRAVTTSRRGEETVRLGYVTFDGIRGGMIHRLLGRAHAGSKVVPRFRPRKERTGSVDDIQGFESRS